MLERNPFLTDEQLAKALEVSIQTIRLDRLRMNIPEVRERTRQMAENAQTKLKAIDKKDIVGDLIDLELNKIGISMLKITPEMVLEKTGVARGYYMFAMANTLALAVVDADAALTGVEMCIRDKVWVKTLRLCVIRSVMVWNILVRVLIRNLTSCAVNRWKSVSKGRGSRSL